MYCSFLMTHKSTGFLSSINIYHKKETQKNTTSWIYTCTVKNIEYASKTEKYHLLIEDE